MAKITEVSRWSCVIRKTDKGFQARIFPNVGENAKPKYINVRSLDDLFDGRLKTELLAMPDEFMPLAKPKE